MIVLDASAAVDLLLRNAQGRVVASHIGGEDLATVAHLDAEVLGALARLHRDGAIEPEAVLTRIRLLAELDIERLPITGLLLEAAWRLRDNVAIRDALYVAAARALRAQLVTTDQRLRHAVGDLAVDFGSAATGAGS